MATQTVGQLVRGLRERKGWTVYRLAKLIGVSPINVTRIEESDHPGGPRLLTAAKLADVLGVSVEEFAACVRPQKRGKK